MRIKNARTIFFVKKKHLPCGRLSLERHFSLISFPHPSVLSVSRLFKQGNCKLQCIDVRQAAV